MAYSSMVEHSTDNRAIRVQISVGRLAQYTGIHDAKSTYWKEVIIELTIEEAGRLTDILAFTDPSKDDGFVDSIIDPLFAQNIDSSCADKQYNITNGGDIVLE